MKQSLQKDVLALLAANARIPVAEMADRLNISEADAAAAIRQLEEDKFIYGYHTLIDESKLSGHAGVKAMIEVKVRPERDGGFDKIARRLSRFPQVYSLFLMSGPYDLLVEVHGDNLNDVANFVASKLSTIDGVLSTATHFLLKKYKDAGTMFQQEEEHERLPIVP